jgi:hypothetical protein
MDVFKLEFKDADKAGDWLPTEMDQPKRDVVKLGVPKCYLDGNIGEILAEETRQRLRSKILREQKEQ